MRKMLGVDCQEICKSKQNMLQQEFWLRRKKEAVFMGITCCLWDLYFEYPDLFLNHSNFYNILHCYFFLSAFVCMMLNVKGLVQEQLPKYDLVLLAYILTIIQISIRQADFGGYNLLSYGGYGDIQYLMFSRGPLLMIML